MEVRRNKHVDPGKYVILLDPHEEALLERMLEGLTGPSEAGTLAGDLLDFLRKLREEEQT